VAISLTGLLPYQGGTVTRSGATTSEKPFAPVVIATIAVVVVAVVVTAIVAPEAVVEAAAAEAAKGLTLRQQLAMLGIQLLNADLGHIAPLL